MANIEGGKTNEADYYVNDVLRSFIGFPVTVCCGLIDTGNVRPLLTKMLMLFLTTAVHDRFDNYRINQNSNYP